MKVIMILMDGMRPDALVDIPEVEKMKGRSSYTLNARTVYPSVTLPCHMSLFHSVDPSRHGTTTNVYAPQVRPVRGLIEVLGAQNKKSAMFYSWEELRDITRPGILVRSDFLRGKTYGHDFACAQLTENAIEFLRNGGADFTFLYIGWPDGAGHGYGWMGDEYMHSVRESWKRIDRIIEEFSKDYTVIVTADHGGHDRIHGTTLDEDMTIPMFFKGKDFECGKVLEGVNIMDIAPTVVKLLGVVGDEEWEGKSLI
jgi:predicted AlkP superfamily pyrophosphatase or phosphodiesterase